MTDGITASSSELPPKPAANRVITYQLTRWDIFVSWLTIFLRSRMLQVFVLVAIVLQGWLVLGPEFAKRPLSRTIAEAIAMVIGLAIVIAVSQCILGLAAAFLLKQRGLVGQHVLEITDEGLVERTDYNEALHKWPSVCRILSLFGYLFVYVSDNNYHQIPKRHFSPQEIHAFETDIRARAPALRA